MRRLLPEPGPVTVDEQLDGYRPWEQPRAERPFVGVNFAVTVDGRATIEGRSGAVGSATDTRMLARLRTRFEALMIGAGTMRAERYGRPVASRALRERRQRLGLPDDLLTVIVSGSLDLPWDAPLFGERDGEVLIFTSSRARPPRTAAAVDVVRHDGSVNLAEALRHLRQERGVRALICEGGPHLHAQLQAQHLVDDLFLTVAPKLSGGEESPRIVEGPLDGVVELNLAWLLEEDGELFARYSR